MDNTTQSASTGSPDASWFRPDVDGLRAVAIVLVVLFHADFWYMDAGFIGVDVFFVISGFLITRNLIRESDRTERISLIGFWARRVRRLVPALFLVTIPTLLAAWRILPLHQRDEVSEQAMAASVYLSNIYFVRQADDYFAADLASSPFLHTWSLGVEEQFYVVWPLMVAAAVWAAVRFAGHSPARRRQALAGVFGLVLVGSFAVNLALTGSSSWAFYGLQTRAWEFAAAGLLAVAPMPSFLRSVGARTALAAAGFATLGIGGLVIESANPYPGTWALIPVVATLLIIAAGYTYDGSEARGPVATVLALPPMQWIGRVSYSWYLWHWPFIILAVAHFNDDSIRLKTAAAFASLPVAAAAYHWFENPVRFTPSLARSSGKTFAAGAGFIGASVILALVLAPGVSVVDLDELETVNVSDLQAPPGSSLDQRLAVAIEILEQRSASVCPKVGAVETVDGDLYCIDGDPDGTRSVMLIGDSHAGQWRRPLASIARERGIRLLVRQHNGCPPFRIDVTADANPEEKQLICMRNQEGDLRVIEALEPDAIIVATWSGDGGDILGSDGDRADEAEMLQIWEEATDKFYRHILDRGIELGVILDEPTHLTDPVRCLTEEGDIKRCERPLDEAVSKGQLAAERRNLAELPEVATFDMAEIVCPDGTCLLEIDGILTYVDRHHLSDAYAASLQPQLERTFDELFLAPAVEGELGIEPETETG